MESKDETVRSLLNNEQILLNRWLEDIDLTERRIGSLRAFCCDNHEFISEEVMAQSERFYERVATLLEGVSAVVRDYNN